jgi:hypothetical protein
MKIKNDFKLREICGEYVVTAEGMQAVDFTKLISLNETAAFLWKTAEKQGEFTVASLRLINLVKSTACIPSAVTTYSPQISRSLKSFLIFIVSCFLVFI